MQKSEDTEKFDLIIVGTGSGNSVITNDFDSWRIAIIERGVFGGTCLNRGCIPSKMLVYLADTIQQINTSSKLGIDATVTNIRWQDVLNRIYGRIDPIAQSGEDYRNSLSNVTVFNGHARFTSPKTIEVNDHILAADNIVIASGAKPFIPNIPGIESVHIHTSDTIMRLEKIPSRLTILGGGYIATEMAHIFSALGSDVTLIARGTQLLNGHDKDISRKITDLFQRRITVHLDTTIKNIKSENHTGIELDCSSNGNDFSISTDELLVATGRVPTSDELNLSASDIQTCDGYITTNKYMMTNVDGVFALGDVTNPAQLKHTANSETRVISHNLIHPNNMIQIDLDPIPHAVFTNPQIASVGATEQELYEAGVDFVTGSSEYTETAYGWAMEEVDGFCKIIADPNSSLLLGAHILGPQASTLIHQLIQGMKFDQTIHELSRGMLYVHPALSEVVENALLDAVEACT